MDPIEQEIQAKGLTAPRIKIEDIEAAIASEHYFTGREAALSSVVSDGVPSDLDLITICFFILKNGHRIVGVNEGPISAENFDADIGRKLARQDAIRQCWVLLGYELRSKLAAAAAAAPAPLGIAEWTVSICQSSGKRTAFATLTDRSEHRVQLPDGINDDEAAQTYVLAEVERHRLTS